MGRVEVDARVCASWKSKTSMRLSAAVALCVMVACGDALTLHCAMKGGNAIRCCSFLQLRKTDTVLCNADSWSTVASGELDMVLLREWVQAALQAPGSSIHGMAGVLSIYCADNKYVLRGAHLHGAGAHLEGEFVDAWSEGEVRESKLIFLGSDLDHEALERGLTGCVVSPETLQKRYAALRFTVGDTVECRTQRGWSKARVVDRLFRDESMSPGLVAPYQLQLEEGGALIFAPEDSKEVVRAIKLERLRFAVDDVVECNLGERWAKGMVVDLCYREPGMQPAVVAPYQIELEEGGTLIYAPSDSKEVIRTPRRLFGLSL